MLAVLVWDKEDSDAARYSFGTINTELCPRSNFNFQNGRSCQGHSPRVSTHGIQYLVILYISRNRCDVKFYSLLKDFLRDTNDTNLYFNLHLRFARFT